MRDKDGERIGRKSGSTAKERERAERERERKKEREGDRHRDRQERSIEIDFYNNFKYVFMKKNQNVLLL